MDKSNDGKKKCDFCGESIFQELRRCPYCGSLLEINTENHTEDLTENEATAETVDEGKASETVDFVLVRDSEEVGANNTAQENSEVIIADKAEAGSGAKKRALNNGMKVFLTIISTVIPGIGQLVGIIISIMLMNCEYDEDRRSFGIALLTASLVFFVISCIAFFIIMITYFPVSFTSCN